MKPPGLSQLRILVTIIDAGGFSAAAPLLGLTQPTLSTHIQRLEADMQTTLLDRSSKNLRLTAAGEVLAGYARQILALSTEAVDQMARLTSRPVVGILKIGGTTTAGERILPERLQSFLQKFPDVNVELCVSNSSDIVGQIMEGGLSLALVAADAEHGNLLSHEVGREPQMVIIPASHPLAGMTVDPHLLHGSTVLLREVGSSTRLYQEELLAQWRIPSAKVSSIASSSAIVNAVACGLGISCLPSVAVQDAVALGRVGTLHLDPPPQDRPISLVRKRDRSLSHLEELFVAHLEEGPIQ